MLPAKKSLGQNFLHSMGAVHAMVEASRVTKDDIVLEIGPGKGVLTEFLLKTGAQVIAVEKDDRMIPHLSERFGGEVTSGKLKLIHGDILDMSPKDLGILAGKYKLVANIPYYITGELIQKFLETDTQPSLMTLMLQKEVARRIVAKDAKESILSLSVKAYGSPKYIQTVSAGSFNPVPSVDSAILLIDNISDQFFIESNTTGQTASLPILPFIKAVDRCQSQTIDSVPVGGGILNPPPRVLSTSFKKGGMDSQEFFFKLIKAGFAHKRKKLIRNLETIAEKTTLENTFSALSIAIDTRAEDLDLKQWKTLAHALK